MMSNDADTIQELTGRVAALDLALRETLDRLATFYGGDAKREIQMLRDELLWRWRNSGISPELELEHAKFNRPAIDATELAFNAALEKL